MCSVYYAIPRPKLLARVDDLAHGIPSLFRGDNELTYSSSEAPTVAQTYAGEPFFSAHFASTSLCFFFGSFKCSAQRKRKHGPFERFPHPGKRQLMSRFRPRRGAADPF